MLKTIKVLIIDDSNIVHMLLGKVISENKDITIIGNGYNGKEGVDLVNRLAPDVIIMDINMPQMDGLEAIQEIMNVKPTPIIVFSAASKSSIDVSFKAIELGAVELIEKPHGENALDLKRNIEEKLLKSIRTFYDFKVIRRIKKYDHIQTPESNKEKELTYNEVHISATSGLFPVIGIAASTGGPQTLKNLINVISSKKIDAAIVIVQHMAEGFMDGFCEWLSDASLIPVTIAQNGSTLLPMNIYIAPGEYHLAFDAIGRFSFLDIPPIQGIRPSADIMFGSLGETFKTMSIGVILTGMGSDGTEGLRKLKEHGGYAISQDEESSLIFGMPKSAIEAGVIDTVLNVNMIPDFLEKICDERLKIGL
jgi:two-component system, chemotaxis family, protein-glutamate methylesterase/glutaminase